MNYSLNPACDAILWGRRAEFLFFHDIVQIETDELDGLLEWILTRFQSPKGCSLRELQSRPSNYNTDYFSTLFHELVAQEVLIPTASRKERQDLFCRLVAAEKKNLLLWSSLPQPCSIKYRTLVKGVGFRLGHQYILSFWNKARAPTRAAQQMYEWAASRDWLKRGSLLFRPTKAQQIIVANAFIPSDCFEWLQNHLSYLIERHRSQEGIYVVDLNHASTQHHPLAEQRSRLCFIGPFEPVLEALQQNSYVGEPFERSCTGAATRYSTPIANWKDDAWAWGSSTNPSLAMDIAYSEAIERYCAGSYPKSSIRKGALQEKPSVRIDPYSLLDVTAEQLTRAGLKVFTGESKALWVPGVELFSGRSVELLADLCLYPLNQPKGYGPYFWTSSSGMAAHRTKEEATLRALFELIERDAFMVTWFGKKNPPKITVEILPEEVLRRFRDELQTKGFNLELLDITRRGIPTVMAVLHRDVWPAFCCGCSTRLTFREAAIKAFREAESGLFGALQDETEKREVAPQDVRLPEDHGCLYYNPEHLARVKFLWESDYQSSLPEIASHKVMGTLELAHYAGISMLYRVEYFSPTPLLSVVRLDSPNLVSVTFGYGLEPRVHEISEETSDMFPHPLA